MSRENIWLLLKQKGFSDVACAAILGNMEAESNCEANRLQGDFTSNRTRSISYTAQVDSGDISRNNFIYNGPNGGGYGLCQWTYWSRKAGLYDMAKNRGVSIGDEAMQVDYFVQELCQTEFSPVRKTLLTSDSIRACSDALIKGFEKPADQSDTTCVLRAGYAQEFYDRYAGSAGAAAEPSAGSTGTAAKPSVAPAEPSAGTTAVAEAAAENGSSAEQAADMQAETETAADANEATGTETGTGTETVGIVPKGSMTQEEYTYAERAVLIILYLKEVLQMLNDFEVEGA